MPWSEFKILVVLKNMDKKLPKSFSVKPWFRKMILCGGF